MSWPMYEGSMCQTRTDTDGTAGPLSPQRRLSPCRSRSPRRCLLVAVSNVAGERLVLAALRRDRGLHHRRGPHRRRDRSDAHISGSFLGIVVAAAILGRRSRCGSGRALHRRMARRSAQAASLLRHNLAQLRGVPSGAGWHLLPSGRPSHSPRLRATPTTTLLVFAAFVVALGFELPQSAGSCAGLTAMSLSDKVRECWSRCFPRELFSALLTLAAATCRSSWASWASSCSRLSWASSSTSSASC